VNLTRLSRAIVGALTDELRRAPWKGAANPLAGHCYVASEAAWHLLGGPASGWTPCVVRHEGATHWFLRRGPAILDLTRSQFRSEVPYRAARGCGFLSSHPSARARVVIERAKESL
jgi:hypothetical protein